MDAMPFGLIAALVGLLGGLVLGLAARLGDFCTLGALESAIYGRDQSRMRLWGIVLGVAILGTQTGVILGWIDLGSSMYQAISGNLAASVAGGVDLGDGMAMAGNCGFGALAELFRRRGLAVACCRRRHGHLRFRRPSGAAGAASGRASQPAATGPQGMIHDLQTLGIPAAATVAAVAILCLAWDCRMPCSGPGRR